MDYLFENLGDERFQEFCNCIVAKEFPNSQSFPVGQPDGGRDSIVYLMDSTQKDFFVFQVKYVRNPNSINDTHKWLTDTIKGEAKKIDKLIPKGAKRFYLLTNVKGTAHLDVGSRDKVNNILETNINIPSICWWREDLSRLFEKDPIFKWSFPEILNGQDILNSILFQNINEHKERKEDVVKAYLADQYAIDNQVKFKQIDLQNKLFGLFTDVPIKVKKYDDKNRALKKAIGYFDNYNKRLSGIGEAYIYDESESLGAASFLLHPKVQDEINRILLEGGPGQGKSTISQYICQVHRSKLLNKRLEVLSLPDSIKHSPLRLPFKIDLRHVASWVEQKNPYQARLTDEYFSKIWKNSLESFLVGHIVYHSQIDTFTTSDLISIIKHSSTLFVFDGFDEIANFKVREEVIEFINEGINRLSENSKSIQVLITSRPAAFSDTIGFSIDLYPHFELTDITPSITREYVDNWIKSSKLDNREASDLRRLVDEKLKMPHLKDLAKSPMQLAIFISLLRTRGESLPNKRTALYDSYIDLFFNREAEKNSVIRDQRDLIIDIHQYLAWVLHSEAETHKNSGIIHIDDLKVKLKNYLEKEGHKTDITDQLFHVVEERVCALVSRVQGTFEFEVQPLREYFCAKFLYNTSPYSPVGSEKQGTKPERFDAISRNFYWNNVLRFFAGCFDKGELPMLIQKIKELQEDQLLRYTNYPRLVTSQILSDWVFKQYPLLLKDVVKIIVDGINIGSIINQDMNGSNNDNILLPIECGRPEVIEECFDQLKKFPNNDYATELIGIINNNPYSKLEYWVEFLPYLNGNRLTKWFEYAYLLEIIHLLDNELIINTIQKDDLYHQEKILQIVIDGNKFEIINTNPQLKKISIDAVLDNNLFVHNRKHGDSSLQFLSYVLHPFITSSILFTDLSNLNFASYLINRFRPYYGVRNNQESSFDFVTNDEIDKSIQQFKTLISPVLNQEMSNWKKSLEPWDLLIESGRHCFGDRWIFYINAVIAAGIKSKLETYDEFINLHDDSLSLCKRVRCARLKSGNLKYWEAQLENSSDLTFTLLVLFSWATPNLILHLQSKLTPLVLRLSTKEFKKLSESLERTVRASRLSLKQTEDFEKELSKLVLNDEIKYFLSFRFSEKARDRFIFENITIHSDKIGDIADIKLEYLITKYLSDTSNTNILKEIKSTYSLLKNSKLKFSYYRNHHLSQHNKIPIGIAQDIMKDAKAYPRIVASIAEKSCRLFANEHLKAVGLIAEKDKWFE